MALWRVLVNTSGVASLRQQVHATTKCNKQTENGKMEFARRLSAKFHFFIPFSACLKFNVPFLALILYKISLYCQW